MTRDDLLQRIGGKLCSCKACREHREAVVLELEALGLIKFDEPSSRQHEVPCVQLGSCVAGAYSAFVREDTLVKTLRQIGYEVKPTPECFRG